MRIGKDAWEPIGQATAVPGAFVNRCAALLQVSHEGFQTNLQLTALPARSKAFDSMYFGRSFFVEVY